MKREERVLIVGNDTLVHSIASKLAKDGITNIFCLPGNSDTKAFCTNVSGPENVNHIVSFAKNNGVNLIIINSDQLFYEGITDILELEDLCYIGPTPEAAQLGTSKSFTRKILNDTGCIKQPLFRICVGPEDTDLIRDRYGFPLVIKANGPTDGKGIYICQSEPEYRQALSDLCKEKIYGQEACNYIIVEEFLNGPEFSVFALCDSKSFKIIGTSQYYQRSLDDDKGSFTKGMGAISPSPYAKPKLVEKIKEKIIAPILGKMWYEGMPFTGFLHLGIMLIEDEPYVIKINIKLEEPETQAFLPLITSSFFDLLINASNDCLDKTELTFSGQSAVSVANVPQ